jgi:hypothetical protein
MQDDSHLFYHFSIDDVIDSLIEVSNSSEDFFSHRFFKFLDSIHEKYETNVDLYCFYQKKIGNKLVTLNDVSDKFKQILINNYWLHFGPHALDYESAPYAQTLDKQIQAFDLTYNEIERFSGNVSKCEFVRLHFFSESFELSDYFQEKKTHSLFTTDKLVIAHRLNDDIKSKLRIHGYANFNNIRFIRSHFRIENLIEQNLTYEEISDLLAYNLSNHGFVTFFTHEREIIRPEIQKTIEFILNYLKKHKITSI